MEITDILRPNSLNNIGGYSKNETTGNAKFRQMLEKSMESGQVKHDDTEHKMGKPIDKRLMDTCIEMESIFVSKMMKEMRNTLPKEKLLDGGFAENIFEDMLYDEYSLNLSKNSNLGLAKMIYNDLSRK
jgi:peptidoglycan hydrolase FlgJ